MQKVTSLQFMTTVCLSLVVYVAQGQEQNLGRFIGTFDQGSIVQGNVYAASTDTILIDSFTFNPVAGTDAFFFIGSQIGLGSIIIVEEGGAMPLRSYNNERVVLRIFDQITNYQVLYIWIPTSQVNLGTVSIPVNLVLPAEVSLGELGLTPVLHEVHADDVVIVNAKQLRLENFAYDNSAPAVYFWVGTGSPSSNGQRVPNENGVIDEPLSRYNGETITITLPDTLTVFEVDYFSVWCERFAVDFGHVMILMNLDPQSLPAVLDLGQPKMFGNCQVLEEDKFQIAWTVDTQRDVICIQLRGKVDLDEYMAFGISGSPTSTLMRGSDVTVGWIDAVTMQANAVDYSLENYLPCSVNLAIGACPDILLGATDDVTLIDSEVTNGVTFITYEKPLTAVVDLIQSDLSISLDRPVFISWAYGRINADGLVTRHETRTPGNVQIDFGTASSTCPDFTPETDSQPVVPWVIPPIVSLTSNTFTAFIGPSGGLRGVQGITGVVGWGIAWYINNAIIPEITVSRGVNYVFVVNGGNDPSTQAYNHPFYITSSERGGYSQLTEAQQQLETVFAGPASGPLCEWKTTADPVDHPSFSTYQATLSLECVTSRDPAGILQWTPDNNTPDLVYYQCYTHQYLGWKINVVGEAPAQPCDSQPCQNGGICTNFGTTNFICDCTGTGFTGTQCQIVLQILLCETQPCRNGGTCTNMGSTFQCECPTGFSGPTCSVIQILPCDLEPCRNGGTCTNVGSAFQCECPTGFSGPTCSIIQILPCETQPCRNGGTCTNVGSIFQCECLTGFSGPTCSNIVIIPCELQPCANGGTCTNIGSTFQCSCPTGFTGTICSIPQIFPCDFQQCENGGTCMNMGSTFQCMCATGFTGVNCENPTPGPCDFIICLNGGSCVNLVNGPACQCNPQFTGFFCERTNTVPCGNDGICVNDNSFPAGFRCVCSSEFEGLFCEHQTCNPNPCRNGATCTLDALGMPLCFCDVGFRGNNCQFLVNGPCDNSPCMNGGICNNIQLIAFQCDCSSTSFTGQRCDIPLSLPCNSNPCINGGTCRNTGSNTGFICLCAPPFTGTNCQRIMLACDSAPCMNGGVCGNANNAEGFTCNCPASFTGPRCQEPDMTPPTVLNCPDNIEDSIEPGLPGMMVSWTEPTAQDNSGMVNLISRSHLPNDMFLVGSTTVSYMFSDARGNTVQCTFCITINTGPQTNPFTVTCPDDICMVPPAGMIFVQVVWSDPVVSGGVGQVNQLRGPAINSAFYQTGTGGGITYQFSDSANNFAECDFRITVMAECQQTTSPLMVQNCPGDMSRLLNQGSSSVFVDWDDLVVTGDDSVRQVLGPASSSATFRLGETLVEYLFQDDLGQTTTCTFTVTVTQMDPGSFFISCPSDIVVTVLRGVGGGIVSWNLPAIRDNSFVLVNFPRPPGSFFQTGTTPISYAYLGPVGESEECAFLIIVNEASPCDSPSCQNGGTCIPLTLSDFTCACPGCFRGDQCEDVANACAGNQCQNGGTCQPFIGSCEQYFCLCPPCLSGIFCELQTNPCDSSNCGNGAICSPSSPGCSQFTCQCQGCFSGPLCDQEFNPCSNNPCQNGGICQPLQGSCTLYTCDCQGCFTGFNCEIPFNPCQNQPCLNGGTCRNDPTSCSGYSCDCAQCFVGFQCELAIDSPCDDNPCLNGGTCVRTGGSCTSFVCLCQEGFGGPLCQTVSQVVVNSCSSVPCQNGGSCLLIENGYHCICRVGYRGSDCASSIDGIFFQTSCFNGLCQNGGTCYDSYTSTQPAGISSFQYTCLCPSGFTGRACLLQTVQAVTFDACSAQDPDYCSNNGACVNAFVSISQSVLPVCDCPPGFAGQFCGMNVGDSCIPNPCRNDGQCMGFGQYFICSCVQPFAGETCESLQVDRNPPDIVNCPTQTIVVRTTQTHAVVNWSEPTATDDSQFPVRLTSANAAPGAVYPVGTSFRVFYNFEDVAGNTASCSFIIQVVSGN